MASTENNSKTQYSAAQKRARTRSGFIVSMHDDLPAYTGEHMAHFRYELQLSQPQFAVLLGVSLQAIKAWETNRNPPPLAVQRLLYLMDIDRQNIHRLCEVHQP